MTRAGIAFLAAPIVIGTGFGADVYSLVAGLAPATVVTLLALSMLDFDNTEARRAITSCFTNKSLRRESTPHAWIIGATAIPIPQAPRALGDHDFGRSQKLAALVLFPGP